MEITREAIRNGEIRRLIASTGVPLLTNAQLRASRRDVLDGEDISQGVWIFGYGSLIWNPAFHFDERRPGKVHGYHRRFCLWVHLGRGTPDNPGLMLGLENGGSCHGVAFRIADDSVESEMEVLWLREMVSGAYVPRWVTVKTDTGPVRAIAFTMNREYQRYAGRLSEERIIHSLATASGYAGSSAQYLISTVEHLDAMGIHDTGLHSLLMRVRAARSA